MDVYPAPLTDHKLYLTCCGTWTDYPSPGIESRCPECGTLFTIAPPTDLE